MFMTEELSNSSSTAFSNVYPSCKCIKPEEKYNIISNRMLQKYQTSDSVLGIDVSMCGYNILLLLGHECVLSCMQILSLNRDVSGNYYSIMLHFNVNLVY